ncbi:RagB/SusD family nutrient uptake outer membrane protein [Chitinophaga sp.]|uniref:RagB/SusD family nutrient uptake outer membrane protein n=1 Tax=Chitinophaga sp. TaxID=1869181 RepID=UPI002D808A61|nr:RagB/SusD family nutrient uptake outer membrane protein [Chitinophaga sp.]
MKKNRKLNRYGIYRIWLCVVISMTLTAQWSCNKEFLERQPTDFIDVDGAYGSREGVAALMATLYSYMWTEDFNYSIVTEAGFLSQVTDEALRAYPWGGSLVEGVIEDGAFSGSWRYGPVRQVNDFIARVSKASISEDERKVRLAEARFLRAFYYFTMVKAFGGVPLLTVAQQLNGNNTDELKVPRNSEKEVYDFIIKEVDAIVADLPESYGDNERFRATRYAALALKCRAALYAGSIAKYGFPQLNGLLGFPAGAADGYWQTAYDAATQIMNSGNFGLYNALPDKAANFQQLFLTGADAANKEAIFVKAYKYPGLGHSFDFYNAPYSYRIDYGCVTNPTLEMAEEFEYTDGTPGKLKVTDAGGNLIRYANPQDLFRNKDPRFFATIMSPMSAWQGDVLEVRRGIIDNGVKKGATNPDETYGSGENTIRLMGKDGLMSNNGDYTKTGFYLKKFMTPDKRVNSDQSVVPWMVFRYGEVLLNYAEAAMELNRTGDALNAVNEIRKRAGIALRTTVTIGDIRHERRVELAFENHRWWDMRRWRIADQVMDNTKFHVLYPWLMWKPNTPLANMDYTFEVSEAPRVGRTFPPKLYYEMIPKDQINRNSNLVQNPLY